MLDGGASHLRKMKLRRPSLGRLFGVTGPEMTKMQQKRVPNQRHDRFI